MQPPGLVKRLPILPFLVNNKSPLESKSSLPMGIHPSSKTKPFLKNPTSNLPASFSHQSTQPNLYHKKPTTTNRQRTPSFRAPTPPAPLSRRLPRSAKGKNPLPYAP